MHLDLGGFNQQITLYYCTLYTFICFWHITDVSTYSRINYNKINTFVVRCINIDKHISQIKYDDSVIHVVSKQCFNKVKFKYQILVINNLRSTTKLLGGRKWPVWIREKNGTTVPLHDLAWARPCLQIYTIHTYLNKLL